MTSPAWSSAEGASSFLERRFLRLWLGLLFVAGLGYVIIVPPFHAIDEIWHWDRIWTVAQGQLNCNTLPNAAAQFAMQTFYGEGEPEPTPVTREHIVKAYNHVGDPNSFYVATAACGYPAIGYIPAALGIRILNPFDLLEPRPHKMFFAFYAARLANWLVFFACVVFALRITRYPLPVMLFASIPMVVQQSSVLNNDSVQFGCLLLAGALLTTEPTRKRIWWAIVIIALASAMKPINAIASLLVWINLWSGARAGKWRRNEALLIGFASLALPVGAWLLWNATMYLPILGATTTVPVANVNDEAQRELLRSEPLRVLRMVGWQARQLFTDKPIDGGWRGILFVYGWCRYIAPNYVYAIILGALATGLSLLRHGRSELAARERVPRLFGVAAAGALFCYFTVVTYALYLGFTPVGHEGVFGVQGRYFLYAIGVVMFLYPLMRSGPLRLKGNAARYTGFAFLSLSLAGNAAALLTVALSFWDLS